jgi:hypothetical protein
MGCHLCAIIIFIAGISISSHAGPLHVDINSANRADMRTVGWENWQPTGGEMSRSFDDVTVILTAGAGGSIGLFGNKEDVVHGITLGVDGAVATGTHPAVMEVRLEGLTPGPHTFVGYHHALNEAAAVPTIGIPTVTGCRINGKQKKD